MIPWFPILIASQVCELDELFSVISNIDTADETLPALWLPLGLTSFIRYLYMCVCIHQPHVPSDYGTHDWSAGEGCK